MNAHVLTTRTSASSAREVISMPLCNTLPSIISASTRFFAQPRLTMPTLVRGRGSGVCRSGALGSRFTCSSACPQELAVDMAAPLNGEFMTRSQLTVTSSSSSSSAFPFFVIWTASGSRTRIETCLPRNSTAPSAGETQRSKAGLPPLSPTVTFT